MLIKPGKIRIKKVAWSVVCFFILCVSYGQAYDNDALSREIQSFINESRISIPNGGQLAIALVAKDRVLSSGLMMTDDQLIRIQNDTTLFEVGSITKVFTATLLSQLVMADSISLDHKVEDYVPQRLLVNPGISKITFLDLATHHSGLPRDPLQIKKLVKDSNDPWSLYDMDKLTFDLQQSKISKKPKYRYSNVGYTLTGIAIEEIMHDSFKNVLENQLIKPLDMSSSYTSITGASGSVIQGFDENQDQVSNWSMTIAAPAGGLVSNSQDMVRFLRWNMNLDHSLDNEIANKCHAPIRKGPITGTLFSYIGLGWNIIETDLFKRYSYSDNLIWHGGATAGFFSYMGFLKSQNVGVVVLSNFRTNKNHTQKIGEHLLQIGVDLFPR